MRQEGALKLLTADFYKEFTLIKRVINRAF